MGDRIATWMFYVRLFLDTYIRLGEILEKWSESVCYLSIVIVCVNLKNTTPILVPRPKDDITRLS